MSFRDFLLSSVSQRPITALHYWREYLLRRLWQGTNARIAALNPRSRRRAERTKEDFGPYLKTEWLERQVLKW